LINLITLITPNRLQVTASIRTNSIKISASGSELILQNEKTIRQNLEGIPIPSILNIYLEYWIKYVVPKCKSRAEIEAIWLNESGNPMEYKEISKSIIKAIKQFNPALHITPISMRRMKITSFFKNSQKFIETNVKDFTELLNVSEKTMLMYYNRETTTKRVKELYEKTTGT
jgi:hypothetical protein